MKYGLPENIYEKIQNIARDNKRYEERKEELNKKFKDIL